MELVQAGGKGKVAIYNRDGLYWLRWSYKGKRYSLAVGHSQIKPTRALAARIETDMAAGHFDATLNSYRPQVDQKVDQTSDPVLGVQELWQMFMDARRLAGTSEFFINNRFQSLARNLARWGKDITSEDNARAFIEYLRTRQSPSTANDNLRHLKSFGRWAVEQGHREDNYFEKIKPGKVQIAPKRDHPFSADEVKRFLATIKTDPHYFSYHDFCYCLFHLGTRPSELIGLRWGAIDFNRRMITIAESLSRGDDGKSAGYARKRKSTKNGTVRILPMTETVYGLLMGRFQESQPKSPDELVFTSPTGRAIDDHNFSQRCWRSICQRAGIPYRPPYIARHTALSHIVESTGSLAQAAAVAGHNSLRMVSQTYGHLVSRVQMPDYEK
jgi:integrase